MVFMTDSKRKALKNTMQYVVSSNEKGVQQCLKQTLFFSVMKTKYFLDARFKTLRNAT
jgi:hypothetical protein